MNPMGISLLLPFLCYEMNSLRRDILGRIPWWWHSVSMNMVVWIKVLQAETANLYPENEFYSRKEVSLPHTWWKRYNEINLPPGKPLVSPGNAAISWVHVGLFCWKIEHPAVAVSKAVLSNGKFMFLSPCISSIPATMDTLFTVPLDKNRDHWINKVTDTTKYDMLFIW